MNDYRTSTRLLSEITNTTTGDPKPLNVANPTIQYVMTGTGAISGTVITEVSNSYNSALPSSGQNTWDQIVVTTFLGADKDSDSVALGENCSYQYIRCRVTAMTGTDAKINVYLEAK